MRKLLAIVPVEAPDDLALDQVASLLQFFLGIGVTAALDILDDGDAEDDVRVQAQNVVDMNIGDPMVEPVDGS